MSYIDRFEEDIEVKEVRTFIERGIHKPEMTNVKYRIRDENERQKIEDLIQGGNFVQALTDEVNVFVNPVDYRRYKRRIPEIIGLGIAGDKNTRTQMREVFNTFLYIKGRVKVLKTRRSPEEINQEIKVMLHLARATLTFRRRNLKGEIAKEFFVHAIDGFLNNPQENLADAFDTLLEFIECVYAYFYAVSQKE